MKPSIFYRTGIVIAVAIFLLLYLTPKPSIVDSPREIVSAKVQQTVTIISPLPTTASGETDYSTISLSPVKAYPRNLQEGAESIYDIGFSSPKDVTSGSSIALAFPSGFNFLASCASVMDTAENRDINGVASNSVGIASITCASDTKSIAITTKGGSVAKGDVVRFSIQGIVNPVLINASQSSSYFVSIQIPDATPLTALPFSLTAAGTRKISGVLFNDNGVGLVGFARDGIQNGSEPGLSGIPVCLTDLQGSRCTVSDANGYYRFAQLLAGTYVISTPPLTSGNVVGGPFSTEVKLSESADKTGIHFAYRPAQRQLSVRVTNIPNQTDVEVYASSSAEGGSSVVRTILWNGQNDRTLSLPVVDGIWAVGVRPLDPNTAAFISPTPQTAVINGTITTAVTFPLQAATATIRGRVLDGAGNGLKNAFVTAFPSSLSGGRESSTQSLANGFFELKVKSGLYRIEASLPGMPPAPSVSAYGGSENVLLYIPKSEWSVSGRVYDDQSRPISGAFVDAEEVSETGDALGARASTQTDASGLFTLFVSDGQWKIRAVASGSDIPEKIISIYGKNLVDQDMRASNAQLGSITGTITQDGAAVVGALVSAFGPAGKADATTGTDGRYTLRTRAGSGYTIEAYLTQGGRLQPIEGVTVGAGQTIDNTDFTIDTPGTIIVTIPDVTDAYVEARDASHNGDGTTLNTTAGIYTITVPRGTYTVTAKNPRFGILGAQSNVRVQSGTTARLTFAQKTTFAASGRITSEDASCVDEATVTAIETTHGRMIDTTTDNGGRYSLELPPGSYSLSAAHMGCIDDTALTTFTITDVPVSVAERQLKPATTQLSGIIQLSGKNASLETKVIAESTTGIVRSTSVNTALRQGANYSLGLTPGTWNISARADGYESSKHTITIAGASKTLNLTLAALPGHVPTRREVATIAPAHGGVVKNTDAGAKFAVVIPPGVLGSSSTKGSVSTKVTSAVVTKTATAQVVGGKGIEISIKDSAGKPLSSLTSSGASTMITLPYSRSEVAALGLNETSLMLAVWSEEKQKWTPFATTVDTVNATLSGVPPHFSVFAPIVPAQAPSAFAPTSTTAAPAAVPLLPQNNETPPQVTPQPHEIPTSESSQSQPFQLPEQRESQPVSLPAEQSLKPETPIKKIASPSQSRFFVRRESVPSSPSSPQALPITPETFELSIALDTTSRNAVPGQTITILGELIKSAASTESIPIRFFVRDRAGRIVLEQSETLAAEGKTSFTKTLRLNENLPAGTYSITMEAQYRESVISSSDRFEVRDENMKSQPQTQKQSPPASAQTPSQTTRPWLRTNGISIALLAILLAGSLVWIWYTAINTRSKSLRKAK